MRRGVATIVIVVSIVGAVVALATTASELALAAAQGEPAEAPQVEASQGPGVSQQTGALGASFEVPLEHLVITPSQEAPGAYEVLDVVRLRQASPAGSAGREVAFAVPLPAGHEDVRVLAGFRDGTAKVGPERVEGLVDWAEADGSATVAVAYRIPASTLPHPWPLVRPFAVGALFLMVHPDLRVAVAGAEQAGPVELEGATYLGFVRQNLPAGEAVLLAPQRRPAASSRGGLPAWAWVAVALAMAVAGAGAATISQRRRAAGLRRKLVDAVLTLDAEYAAGYLEDERYRHLRQRLMQRLASDAAADSAAAPPAVKPAAGGGSAP